jgi:hypothetical protein
MRALADNRTACAIAAACADAAAAAAAACASACFCAACTCIANAVYTVTVSTYFQQVLSALFQSQHGTKTLVRANVANTNC